MLVAGLVSISLSDSVPLDWFRCGAILPAGPSPAVLLRSLSAPSVSPELLLIWGHETGSTSTRGRPLGAKNRGVRGCSNRRELAVPYHCTGLRVLAAAPHQDGRLRARDRLRVTFLETRMKIKRFLEQVTPPPHDPDGTNSA